MSPLETGRETSGATKASDARQPGREPKCSVCADKRRSQIEKYLLTNSLRRTAARFGLSKSALHRHCDSHLAAPGAGASQSAPERVSLAPHSLLDRLEQIHAMTLDFFESASGVDHEAAIAALGLLTDQVELALDLASAVPEPPAGGPGGLEIPASGLLELLIACEDGRPAVFPASRDLEDWEGDRFVSMRDLYDEDLSYLLVPLER